MTQFPLINTCIYPGCLKLTQNKIKPGYCQMHRMRIFRYGSPHNSVVKAVRGKAEGPYCALFIVKRKPHKYWATTIDQQTVYVHRLVVEKIINRKLLPNEHVHHRDGNGLNNHPNNHEVLLAHKHNYVSGKWSPGKGEEPF